MTDTIDALETLTRSEGWRILCDAARREWAERERIGVKAVVGGTENEAIQKLRQIVAAREAVEWVLALPSQEIAKLRKQETDPGIHPEFRKALEPILTGMSRRGSL